MMKKKKTVLITWCSTGIGKAIVEKLHQEWWYIIFAGVRTENDAKKLQKTYSWIYTVMLDITKDDEIVKSFSYIDKITKKQWLDVLINNAGIAIGGSLEEITIEEYKKQFDVNVFWTLKITKIFLPLLKKKQGNVFIISSVAWILAFPYLWPYSMSKHALEARSDASRIELRKYGITISLVNVGRVKTPLWEKSLTSSLARFQQLKQKDKKEYDMIVNFSKKSDKKGIPPSIVANKIAQQIKKSKNANARIYIGGDTRLTRLVKKIFPTKISDYIVLKYLQINS